MAKERLSKLQKWILAECFKRISDNNPDGQISRWLLMDKGKINPAKEVSMSRSLVSLAKKGYITLLSVIKAGEMIMLLGMIGKDSKDVLKEFEGVPMGQKALIPIPEGLNKGRKIKAIELTQEGKDLISSYC